MIDAKKVRMMTKLAVYEDGPGKEDLKIHGYEEGNYVNIQMIKTIIAVTVGYGLIIFLYCLRYYSDVASKGFDVPFGEIFLPCAVGYVIVLILSIIYSRRLYRERFRQMEIRLKEYEENLENLSEHMTEKKQN